MRLEDLKKEKVDLIIADIRMPGMTGLELLEQIRREEISDAYFVILSGYAEFDYARRAMQNKCTEYLLKPVDRETLLKLLHKVRALSDRERQESKAHEEMEHAYFSRHLISLIHGKYDDVNLNYVKKHMKDTQGIRYVEIQKEQPNNLEEQSDKDLRNFQRELYDCCREFLKEDAKHCVFDVSADEKIYGTEKELKKASDVVVIGEVIDYSYEVIEDNLYTIWKVKADRVEKGKEKSEIIYIKTLGGRKDT